jgi:hypothetical protein
MNWSAVAMVSPDLIEFAKRAETSTEAEARAKRADGLHGRHATPVPAPAKALEAMDWQNFAAAASS